MEHAPVIVIALLGLVLIFSARRSTMPATAKNKKLLGGALMVVALGLAAANAVKG